jgi:hypothetical protein
MMRSVLLILVGLSLSLAGQRLDLTIEASNFSFIDQSQGAGNACGPASLLNSFGSGSEQFRKVYEHVPGTNDRARIASVIKSWGLKPSVKFPERNRWQNRRGISFTDLQAMSREMSDLRWDAPKPKGELFFLQQNSRDHKLLRTTHQRLAKSLRAGFPPILSVRRFVYRQGYWQSVHGHFVTLTAMPSKLPRNNRTFTIRFLDPLGAKPMTALIALPGPNEKGFPCFLVEAPGNKIGTRDVKNREQHHLALAGAIGVW